MELPKDLATKLNDHIGLELESSLTYLQMAAYFEERSLTGFARWMRIQSEEERAHALRFFDYVLHRGASVELGPLESPKSDFTDAVQIFTTALEQERKVSAAIHDLYRTANDAGDAASFSFLQGFLVEQIEEEAMVETTLDRLRIIAGDGGALLVLDSELGQRTPR